MRSLIECLATVLIVLLVMPAVEYLLHRLVMHHETPLARAVYWRHAVQHHRLGRLDINVDLEWWFALLVVSPLVGLLHALGYGVAGLTLAVLAVGYAGLWTGLHRNFHGVGGDWTTNLPGYRALRRHHLTHHANAGHNFGTVFGPLVDRLLGTWRREHVKT